MALALLVLSGVWLAWPSAPEAGAELELLGGGVAPSSAPPVAPAVDLDEGHAAERNAVDLGALMRVTDAEGVALGDALVVARRVGTDGALMRATAMRATADAEGRVPIAGLPPDSDWLAVAPGFDLMAVDAQQREVALTPLTRVQVRFLEAPGQPWIDGAQVRWVGDPDLLRFCPWLAAETVWRPAPLQAVDWGPLPQRGCAGPVGFEWTGSEACSVVFPMTSLNPSEIWRQGVRSVRYNLEQPAHSGHALPRLRFLDDAGRAIVGGRVRLACNDLWVRDVETDANGEVLVDVHAFDEDLHEAELRVELSPASDRPFAALLNLAEVRARGLVVLGGLRKTVNVHVLTDRPAAFSVALGATHPNRSPETSWSADGELDDESSRAENAEAALDMDPIDIDPIDMDPEDALKHARAEDLQFQALDSEGRATLSTGGLSASRCVIVRHNATGLMVAGLCFVPDGPTVEISAPELGWVTVRPESPTDAPWTVQLEGEPYQFGGTFVASLDRPIQLSPRLNRIELPQGNYGVEVVAGHGFSESDTLLHFDSETVFEFKPLVMRHVRGVVTRLFGETALPDRVSMRTQVGRQETLMLSKDGHFEAWVTGDIKPEELNLGLELPNIARTYWTALPVDPSADEIEFVVQEARLGVTAQGLPFGVPTTVQISNESGGASQSKRLENGYAEFSVQPGTYSIQVLAHGARPLSGVEVSAGDQLVVNVPDQAFGAVKVLSDAPLRGYSTVYFCMVSDELNFQEGTHFGIGNWLSDSERGNEHFDAVVGAADYEVTAALRWTVSQTDSITVQQTFLHQVRANEIGILEVKLLDQLLDKLRAGADTNPDYAAALLELGG